MAELDKIPQKQSIELETVKIDETLLENLKEVNMKINNMFVDMGQIHMRRKELNDELVRLESILEQTEDNFKMTNTELKEVMDAIDEKYPQGRINMQDGTIQYQPGAPTRKQVMEMQQNPQPQQNEQSMPPGGGASPFKVVKE